MKRSIRIAIVVVLLAIAGVATWYYLAPRAERGQPSTIKVERGDVTETVLATGALEANSVTSVGAQVSGTIQTFAGAAGSSRQEGRSPCPDRFHQSAERRKNPRRRLFTHPAGPTPIQTDRLDQCSGPDSIAPKSSRPRISSQTADLQTAQAALAKRPGRRRLAQTHKSARRNWPSTRQNLALSRTTITSPRRRNGGGHPS